jgi:hypothetical protein
VQLVLVRKLALILAAVGLVAASERVGLARLGLQLAFEVGCRLLLARLLLL